MMDRPAYEAAALAHLCLRPSLRAASALERLHGGLAPLFAHVEAFHLGTVRAVIRASATDPHAADAFLAAYADTPLRAFRDLTLAPILNVLAGIIPDTGEEPTAAPSGTPRPWSEAYADLYGLATGWLGWTPAEAWQATPTEIVRAFRAHVDMLRAVHGGEAPENENTPDATARAAQRQANEALGLDPEFDREGLAKLRAKIARA